MSTDGRKSDEPVVIDLARVARELGFSSEQVAQVVALLDEGNTVPFITRYRKERTGNLDEVQIRRIDERVQSLRQLAERAATILRLIESQGKLTPELRAAVEQADSLKRLEDLYLPYRPKRRSRATAARERGLEPLADRIASGEIPLAGLEAAAAAFVNAELGVSTASECLQGASDILAERMSEDADLREEIRRVAWQSGRLAVSATKEGQETGQDYRDYFDHSESVTKLPPHRVLAINRGEKEGFLRVKYEWDEGRVKAAAARRMQIERHPCRSFLEACAADALDRLIQPSLDREIRRELTEKAEAHAVDVFAQNLRNLLLQPPVRGNRVLAIDPGFRTGCKVACLDEYGQCLEIDVVYAVGSSDAKAQAKSRLSALMDQHGCRLIAIGNGTACRETEELVAELIGESQPEARYVVVNEAGASIYSTSTVAREEFPEFDATARGTVSIGRRLLDPLSELVKIDPQHIGVGMYQHDVDPKRLKESLDQVVESCVNYVGVDLNTASASLLRHISGLNQLCARRVVEWREKHGRFRTRQQLLYVAGIGQATFTQAAGFLKIAGGDEPLDATWIHPESYPTARRLLERMSSSAEQLLTGGEEAARVRQQLSELDRTTIAHELGVGVPTFQDILDAIVKPGRDPRSDLQGPVFKKGVLNLDDLAEGMELKGTVLNVVDFGAFVDIGLKNSGLVHVSQMATRFVKNPHEIVSVGDVLTVWVIGIDKDRGRVSLTMLPPGTPRESPPPPPPHRRAASPPASPKPAVSAAPASAPRAPIATTGNAAPPRSVPKPKSPPALSPDKVEGKQPLRGFDELKELWKNRKD